MIIITIRRYNNNLMSITQDEGDPIYQGPEAECTLVYNDEVPPITASSKEEAKSTQRNEVNI